MRFPINTQSTQLCKWVSNFTPSGDHEILLNQLALIRVCKLDNTSTEELNTVTKILLSGVSTFDFTKSSVLVALLACDLILELGSPIQNETTNAYLSLLNELRLDGINEPNNTLLNSAFSEVNNHQEEEFILNLPRFERNIHKVIVRALETAEIKSQFGQYNLHSNEFTILQLESMAIRAQRAYDIPLSMRCLRARSYLTSSDSFMLKTSLDFIQFEQCSDGSFGDHAADVLAIKDDSLRAESLLKMKLIVSLQVIWTLHELNGVNLMSSLSHLKMEASV